MTNTRLRSIGIACAAVLGLVFWLNHLLAAQGGGSSLWLWAAWTWLATAGLLGVFIALIGVALAGRPAGVLIDNRNRISLSKLQALGWTLLILSTLITMAAARLKADGMDALDIGIPPQLLIAMGLSAASLVATPVILGQKTVAPPPTPERLAQAEASTNTPPGVGVAVGRVFGRSTPAAASWLDMFRGEEVDNAGAPDLGKIQQFLVSGILICVYGAMVWNGFADGSMLGPKGQMPPLDQNFIWLLGISHASYLAYKAAPHGAPA